MNYMPKTKPKATFSPGLGAYAIARHQAGGDICAGLLLYRVKYFFDPKKKIKKLKRKIDGVEREWMAMSRDDWAREAGLTLSEMKDRARPKLEKFDYITIRQMCLKPGSPKLLWISLDLVKLHEATLPPDMLEFFPPGEAVFGKEVEPVYPYAKAAE